APEPVHRPADHGAGEAAVLRRNASDPDVVGVTIIAVELDPVEQRARPVGRLDRRGAVGDDNAIGFEAANELVIPKLEKLDRARCRRADRPFMLPLAASPSTADEHLDVQRTTSVLLYQCIDKTII